MGEDKIQKGLRRDGTEVASGSLSVVMKRIRGQSSKRTQSREKARENVFWDAQPGVPNTNSRNSS